MYEDTFIIIIACCSWPVTRYVILLFVFNIVCYDYLRYIFLHFVGFLSMAIQVMLLYIHNVQGIICSAWFLDIRISTCFCCEAILVFMVNVIITSKTIQNT